MFNGSFFIQMDSLLNSQEQEDLKYELPEMVVNFSIDRSTAATNIFVDIK